jgi:LuxR family transcriptional regulator of csgAB operon
MDYEIFTYILGPKKIYNNAIQYLINKEIQVDCEIINIENASHIYQLLENQINKINLILYDHKIEIDLTGFIIDSIVESYNNTFIIYYNVDNSFHIDNNIINNDIIKGVFYDDDSIRRIIECINFIIDEYTWNNYISIKQYNNKKISQIKAEQNKEKSHKLTVKEQQILLNMMEGKSNSEISEELSISLSTVKSHIYHIYNKINVHNRIQACLWAYQNLID